MEQRPGVAGGSEPVSNPLAGANATAGAGLTIVRKESIATDARLNPRGSDRRGCGNDGSVEKWKSNGRIPTFPPPLGNRKRRDFHIPTATTTNSTYPAGPEAGPARETEFDALIWPHLMV